LFGLILRASYPYGITNLTFVEGLAFILWKAHVHVSTCHKQQASVADTNNIGRWSTEDTWKLAALCLVKYTLGLSPAEVALLPFWSPTFQRISWHTGWTALREDSQGNARNREGGYARSRNTQCPVSREWYHPRNTL